MNDFAYSFRTFSIDDIDAKINNSYIFEAKNLSSIDDIDVKEITSSSSRDVKYNTRTCKFASPSPKDVELSAARQPTNYLQFRPVHPPDSCSPPPPTISSRKRCCRRSSVHSMPRRLSSSPAAPPMSRRFDSVPPDFRRRATRPLHHAPAIGSPAAAPPPASKSAKLVASPLSNHRHAAA